MAHKNRLAVTPDGGICRGRRIPHMTCCVCWGLQVQPVISVDPQDHLRLLELPGPALSLVLQQLDQCSLASTAVTCSTLRHAAAAATGKVEVRCSSQATYDSFVMWMEQHSSSLPKLEECSVMNQGNNAHAYLSSLPCRHLRQLHLQSLKVQLGPASGGAEGVLQHCTRLTALSLRNCQVQDVAATAAAIAALPQLQNLHLGNVRMFHRLEGSWIFAELSSAAVLRQLTYLYVDCAIDWFWKTEQAATLSQLSNLANLGHLELFSLPSNGVPGGLPSQLVKLTCLDVTYARPCNTVEQFQHLSSLTALQQLAVHFDTVGQAIDGLSGLSGVQQLSQLTGLKLAGSHFEFGTSNTLNWLRLTALKSLTLRECQVQPEALSKLTQLQALGLELVKARPVGDESHQRPLSAVAQLSMLTSLHVSMAPHYGVPVPAAAAEAAAAFTTLTASTNLCDLRLSMSNAASHPDQLVLFRHGPIYPNLRLISLSRARPLRTQQLQQLCSCCPAVEVLNIMAWRNPSPTAWQPLTQLSALTRLAFFGVGAPVAPVVDAAVQLAGLRDLWLFDLPDVRHPELLKLTALTALKVIMLVSVLVGPPACVTCDTIILKNKERC
jgi:hypothetical protein